MNRGQIAGMALVALYAAGLSGLYAWALRDYVPIPLATAAPGSVNEICFADLLHACYASAPRIQGPLDYTQLEYRFTGPNGAEVPGDPVITISRVEGDQERQVLAETIYIWEWQGYGLGGGMQGRIACDPCRESATYVGRIRKGSRLLAEGFFRT